MTSEQCKKNHFTAVDPTIATKSRRVLVISYPFPPVGGAGVQRVTKFAKYLPQFGWNVSVLTVANPSVPVFDSTLEKDIPPETTIVRTQSWEPGYAIKTSISSNQAKSLGALGKLKKNVISGVRRTAMFFLQPDPQILWAPNALKSGKRLLKSVRHDAIFASGPPFSTFLLAATLSRQTKTPLVLDYRDEWTISNDHWENKRLDPVSRMLQGMMQNRALRAADGIIATTNSSAESLEKLYRKAGGKGWVSRIYNGFDLDDFHATDEAKHDPNEFHLSYIGTLWNLTSVEPLVEAIKLLSTTHSELAKKLVVNFAGRQTPQQSILLEPLKNLPCRTNIRDYIGHSEAVELMKRSDVLCLLLSDLKGAGRVVPAKLFEYMATGNVILTIAPDGETRELLEKSTYPSGQFSPNDINGIAKWLADSILKRNSSEAKVNRNKITEFTRQFQASQLAALLSSI